MKFAIISDTHFGDHTCALVTKVTDSAGAKLTGGNKILGSEYLWSIGRREHDQ